MTRTEPSSPDAPHPASSPAPVPAADWGVAGRLAPVLLAGLGLCQLGLFGLRPALAERERLEAALSEIEVEEVELRETLASLEHLELALRDPIYRERVRRLARADALAAAR